MGWHAGGKGHASGMLRGTRVKPGAFLPEEVLGGPHTSPAVWTRGGVKEWLSEVKEGETVEGEMGLRFVWAKGFCHIINYFSTWMINVYL